MCNTKRSLSSCQKVAAAQDCREGFIARNLLLLNVSARTRVYILTKDLLKRSPSSSSRGSDVKTTATSMTLFGGVEEEGKTSTGTISEKEE